MLHQGNKELDIAIFDYSFMTGQAGYHNKNTSGQDPYRDGISNHQQSIIYFCSTKLDLPQFVLQPEKKSSIW